MKTGVLVVVLGLLAVGAGSSRSRAEDRTPRLWIEGVASTTLATSWKIDSGYLASSENSDEYERSMTGLIGWHLTERTALLGNVRGVIGKYNDISETDGDIPSRALIDRKQFVVGIGVRIILK